MESSQIALKLLLDSLGISPAIKTVNQRMAVQKGVYIAQLAGVDFGYRYNWYVRGPYSPALTRDYYALDKALTAGEDEFNGRGLRGAVQDKLANIKPLLQVPSDVDLNQAHWLELVASVHYLLMQRRKSEMEMKATLADEKAHVVEYVDEALTRLKELKLV